jgi:hypothetical protein
VARIAHQGAGLDAERLGRVGGGDRHGALRQRLHDDDRLAAQGPGYRVHGPPSSSVGFSEHTSIRNNDQGEDLGVSCPDGLLLHFVALGLPAGKPGVGADFSGKAILWIVTEEDAGGEALRGEVLAREPSVGDVGRACEPFPAARTVADENGGEIPSLG